MNLSMSFFENRWNVFQNEQLLARASILIKKDFTNLGQNDLIKKLS